jgi:ABC-type transport system substrate-binding protein
LTITDIIKEGDADREDFGELPIGTGPFKFVSREGDRITVDANADCWRGAPKLAEVVFEYIPDADVRLAALQTGEAQLIDRVTMDQKAIIEADPNLKVIEAATWETTQINTRPMTSEFFLQNTDEQNLLIRQALFHAIDRETIHETILGGLGTVCSGPTSSNLMDFSDFAPYDYDPDRAKALLAEAGYPDGFSGLTMYSSDGWWPKTKEIAEAVVGYWAEIGVEVELVVEELGALAGRVFDNSGDFVHFGSVEVRGDPCGYNGHIYSGEDTTGWHFTGYTSDEANELTRTCRSTQDEVGRLKAAKALDHFIWDNAYYISLFETGQLLGTVSDLTGFEPSPGLVRWFGDTSLAE